MPRYEWKTSDESIVKAINGWEQTYAGVPVRWARESVDTLHYLADLALHEGAVARDHESHVVDVAHLRSACGAAITALDLCGAALARRFKLRPNTLKGREFDLAAFDPDSAKKKTKKTAREGHVKALGHAARRWVAETIADTNYVKVKSFRNPLTHGIMFRHWYRGGTDDRVEFATPSKPHESETSKSLVVAARDFAAARVEAFSLLVVGGEV